MIDVVYYFRIPSYDELVNGKTAAIEDDEDDDELEKAEEFERKYNFRYQEPDAELVGTLLIRHARSMIFSWNDIRERSTIVCVGKMIDGKWSVPRRSNVRN